MAANARRRKTAAELAEAVASINVDLTAAEARIIDLEQRVDQLYAAAAPAQPAATKSVGKSK